MKPRVLDRDQVRRRPRLVVVGVPEARGRHERRARLPLGSPGVDDVAVLVEFLADQRVAAGLAVDDVVQRHRLVAVRD